MPTILIVDDLSANRKLLVTLLGHQGHRVLEAADGSEGLAVARAEQPDLVITDVLMPVMDGYELVRQLRLDPATSAMPVVFYTAHYGEREARELALAGGVSAVLTKPIESAEVLRIVGRVLAGEPVAARASDATPLTTDFGREAPILSKSGEERLIEWRNTLLRDDEGRVIGTFSSGADITEQHRTAEALRTSEERMRFALEAAGVEIWDMDYASGVLRWSGILEAQYSVPPGTFGGTFEAFVERIHPDDRESVIGTFRTAMKSGADFTILNRSIGPDSAARWLSGAGRIHLGENGEPGRGVGISLDVTERRTLEEQYQQAQKMEALGRLAGGVAHDFNNLLTAILGYCELLLDDIGPDDPHHGDVAEIQKAGTRAAGLTRQLLAFSRKQIIEPTLLDLHVVVSDMRSMLGRLIGEDVRIVLGAPSDLPRVKADRGQVEQIVLNLAVNARDAMPRGGTLTIETAVVQLDEHYTRTHLSVQPGPYVVLLPNRGDPRQSGTSSRATALPHPDKYRGGLRDCPRQGRKVYHRSHVI